MAKVLQKTKLVLKDIGNPKKIAADFKGGESVVIGSIIGLATKVVRGKAKAKDGLTDVETTGLGGTFEGVPAGPDMDTVQSGVCYLPNAFMDQIIDVMEVQNEKGEWTRNPTWNGSPIQIAAEVVVTHAANPQGYSWALIPAKDLIRTVDPLAELRKAMLPKPAEQEKIEAPKSKEKAKA